MAAATGVDSPSPDQVTIIRVVAGQPIDLPIDPQQLADAQLQIVGGDLEIKLPDGHIFLLVGFVKAEESGQAPDIVVESGEHMSAEDVLALTGTSLEDLLQTAAGGAQAGTGTANNSASFRHGFLGGLINGLNDEGPIGPTALQYGVPEPLTGPIDKLDDSDQRALMQWHIEGDPLVHEPFFGGKQQQEFRELVAEGTFATYTVFYTGAVLAPGQTASITVETGAGHHDSTPDATGGADYETLSTILTFTGGGATSQTLEVQIFGDTVVEGTEDYSVNLSGQSHGTIVDPTQDTDIVDETSGPFWNIQGDSVVHEGDTAVYTVSYNGAVLAPGITATVTVLTGAGTNGSEPDATAGTDYTALTTVLTFTGGSATAQTVEVHTTDDTVVEGTEDYSVQLADPSHGVISIGTAPTDIIDDDAQNLQWSITGDSLVNEGNAAVYTVTYTGAVLAPGITATVTVQTGPGTNGSEPDADSNTDYTSLSTVLTFTGGDSNAQTVSVQTVDDTLVEGTEDYSVQISGQSAGNITQGTAPTDIVDNDAPNMQWSVVGDSLVSEGNTAIYTVSYSGAVLAPGQTATITVQTGPGTNGSEPDADSNTDYTALSTVLTFTGGQTSQTVEVHTTDDTLIEGTEDYSVNISGQSAGTITQPTAPTDIIDDDARNMQWSVVGDSLVSEGNTAIYTVSYSGAVLAPGQTATITVQTGPGTNGSEPDAEGNTDYTSLSTVLTFTGGQTSQTVEVHTTDDTLVEGTEDYSVQLSGQSAGNITQGTAPTDIVDNDAPNMQWSITGDSLVSEGDTAIYTVSYSGAVLAPGQTATIVVETGPGTNGTEPDAEGNTDYTSLSTTLTFTGGQTAQTIEVHTIDDTLVEGTEDYSVQISGQSAGTITQGTAPTDIVDNDAPNMQWSVVGDSLVTEGNTAIYTVSYSGAVLAPGQTATVTVQTGPGTDGSHSDATSGTDYTALSTVLTFTGGQTAQTVAVHTTDDTLVEGTEDYSVQISGQSAGNITQGTAPTDIIDNDAGNMQWSITGQSTVNEGAGAVYTVSYSGAVLAPGQTALITIQTNSGTATENTDFDSRDGLVLTFTGGQTAQTISVQTTDDTLVEGTENYNVEITNPTLGAVVNPTATTDIIDNDAPNMQWSVVGDSLVTEGNTAIYTVSYSGAVLAPGQTATITVQTGPGTDGSHSDATSPSDFTALSTVLTFTGGQTAQTVAVHTVDDTLIEGTEDYSVNIAGQSVGTITQPTAPTDIIDSDHISQWYIAGDSLVTEGNTAIYTVSYTGGVLAPGQTATITVQTGPGTNGSEPDATSPSDYTALSTVLTFTGGQTAQTVAVHTVDDTLIEGTEDYSVQLSGQSAGVIGVGTAPTDIIDSDHISQWSITGSTQVTEGDTATYTVSYTGGVLAPGQTATITVQTGAGTNPGTSDATAPSDYTALSTVLTFTGGQTAQTVSVHTVDDTLIEGTEDYSVQISGQSAGTIGTGTAPTDIIDGDHISQWNIAGDSVVSEGNTAIYTVSYTGGVLAPGQTATITVQTGPGTDNGHSDAASPSDFTALSTVLTFTGGQTAQTVAVHTNTDTVIEGTEDYSVQISGQSAGTIGTGTAPTDIVDQTTGPFWNITGDSQVTEGADATYTVSYNGAILAPGQTAVVTVQTGVGTNGSEPDATSPSDFTALSTVLTFTGGQTAQTVLVHTVDDTLIEGTEDYSVNISGQSVGVISTATAPTDIIDSDHISQWSITGSTQVTEGDTATYTVSYTGGVLAPGQTAVITVQTGAGANPGTSDATAPSDYTALSTVLTFTGGQTAQTVTVHTTDDTLIEGTEDYSVQISGQSAGTIGTGTAPTDIIDGDHISQWNIAGDSVVSEGNTAIYTVSYTGGVLAPGQTATITVQTGPGTDNGHSDATSPSDFTALSTVLTFTGGQTAQTVAVHTNTDTVIEGTEDYSVQISGQSAGMIGTGTAPTDIVDQTTGPFWNITGDSLVTEGNTATYTVSYNGATLAPGQTALITIQTNSGTATEGTDFDTRDNTVLTFTGGGAASQTLTVHTTDDTAVEGTENYNVQIAGQTVGVISTSTATTDIIDNDASNLHWDITGQSTVPEGADATYTVSYSGATLAPGQTALITIQTNSGTATEGTDFDTRDNTVLTFTGGGAASQTLTVHTNDDTAVEGTENYNVQIAGQTVGTISTSTATTEIIDNDASNLHWDIAGQSQVTEGQDATYTVSYSGATLAPGQTALITIQTNSGTATEGTDFDSRDNTVLTFTGGGAASQTLTVHTIDDTAVEGTENYNVQIAGQTVGTISTPTATTDIVDNDSGNLQWSITGQSTVAEGADATYTVSYAGATLAPGQTALITIRTNSGTATEGTDFDSRDGTVLTFTGGGAASQTLTVHTNDDTAVEGTENYNVQIAGQTVGTISTPTAATDIIDNDASNLHWDITGQTQVTEGQDATYTVSYSGATLAPGQTALITIQTNSGTATESTDFDSRDNTVLTFTGGGTASQTLTVHTIDDTAVEGTENYNIQIAGQTVGTISTPTAATDIIDNDASNLHWDITGQTQVTEGQDATYTVSYSGATLAPGQTALITIQTNSGTATEGTDFGSRDNTVLTFTGGGAASQTLTVHTVDDTAVEGTENYSVQIAGQTVGTISTPTAATDIIDNDASNLHWDITGQTQVTEGQDATYTVSYSGATLAPGQTAFITIQTNSGTATEGTDFDTRDGTVLTFTAGQTAQTLTVHTIDDTAVEGTENYNVQIAGQTVGTISTPTAVTDIIDNDASSLHWDITGQTLVTEGADATYTVSYSGATLAPGQTALITIQTNSGTATEGTDFDTRDGTVLTFTGGGAASQTLTVHTNDDTAVEGTENYSVQIAGQTVGTISTPTAATDIIDNDASNLHWDITGQSTVPEGADATYTVSYSGATLAPGQTALITIQTNSGTATEGTDFGSRDNTVLTFTGGGAASQTLTVHTIDDTAVDGTENYNVQIAGQTVGTISTPTAATDIIDNDASNLHWDITGQTQVTEGQDATYTVSYSGATLAPGQTALITIQTLSGTASEAVDFGSRDGLVLTFTGGGAASQTLTVHTIDDTAVEGTENYSVLIGGQTVGTVSTPTAATDIIDNDASNLHWDITGQTQVTEGQDATYTVSYSGATLAPGQTALITIQTLSGTASEAVDFGSRDGLVLTFTGGGAASQTLTVHTIDDTAVEGTENYSVLIGGQTVGTVSTPTAATDIIDNDSGNLQWSITGQSTVAEGADATYTVSYSGAALAPGQTALITIQTNSGTATEGTDFDSRDNTVLTFTGGGAASQTLTVHTVDDTAVEGTENYNVQIGGQTVGTISTPTAATDIIDNDASNLHWDITGQSQVTEGQDATYTVSYSGATLAPGQTALITIQTLSGTASEAVDFGSRDGLVLTFTGGGAASQTLTVHTIDDTAVEGTENYSVLIGGQTVGTVSTPTAATDIIDNDASNLHWDITGQTQVTEGQDATYTVSYSGATLAPGQTALITIQTLSGTASEAVDFGSRDGLVLTFTGGGAASQTLTVHTIDDTAVEGTENYSVLIGGQTVGTVSTPTAATDIIDNDASNLHWDITGQTQVTEGQDATYTVSYSGATLAPGQTASITVQTGNHATGSPDATAGTDYTVLSTVLTFTGGNPNAQTVLVHTTDDTIVEGTEDYQVQISGQSSGTITQPTAPTDIIDNDASNLHWDITGQTQVTEGQDATYTVSYSGATLAPGQTASVTVQTGNHATGSPDATAGTDYTVLSTVLTFTGGNPNAQTVLVHTTDDTIVEGTEDYQVQISGQSSGTITQPTAPTDIIDNDASNLHWDITGQTQINEGSTAVYTVSYSGATLLTGATAVITIQTNSGTATEGTDFDTRDGTVLTFTGGGATAQTLTVHTTDDTLVEGTEDYSVQIAGQSVGTISTPTAGTSIIDNDASSLHWDITGQTQVTEGANATYTVSYSGAALLTGATAVITIQTNSGAAIEGTDFDTRDGTVLTFTGGGATAQTLTVHTIDDTLVEGTENYNVQIAGQSVGTISTPTAGTNIVDNDASNLHWDITGQTQVAEGANATYTVSYSGATLLTGATAVITIQTNSGTATEGTDFDSRDGTVLTFTGGGATAQTLTVHTTDDTLVEGTETYNVQIAGQNIGTITTPTAGTDIIDNDASNLHWDITGQTQINEGATAVYTVSYSGATLLTGATAVITIQTNSGTATEGTDFDSRDGTVLTFTGGGATTQTLTVHTTDDTLVEGTENYNVQITGQSVGTITSPTAVTDIIDNDASNLHWAINGQTQVNEGSNATYTVSYSGATLLTGATAVITIQTNSGTATEGTDFDTRDNTVLTFTGGGATTQTLTVHTTDDTLVEGTENYNVQIAGQSVGTITTPTAMTDIIDNDASNLHWAINGQTQVNEGATATYTVSYSGATLLTGATAVITIQTNSGTATEGTDFDTRDNTVLTFTGGGATTQTLTVHTTDDTLVEGTENYNVQIAGQSVGTITTPTAVTDIIDNDASNLHWDITGQTQVTEGANATYTVSYSGATLLTGATAVITIQTNSGTATEGTDFDTRDGTVLTFTGGGATAQTLTVHTTEDTLVEGPETYNVQIANQSVGTISTSTAGTTILDNDASNLHWDIGGTTQLTEGGTAFYTVSYTGGVLAPGQTATITVQTGAGTNGSFTDATSPSDFTALSTVLTFTGGQTSQTVAVKTIDDTVVEGTEDYAVRLSGQSAGTINSGTAGTLIIDNDKYIPHGANDTATVLESGVEAVGSFVAGTAAATNNEIATGNLTYDFGGDGPAASTPFTWTTTVTADDPEAAGITLTSGGSPIVWTVSNGGLTLTGTVNGGAHNGEVVAKLDITNVNTGAYKFEQLGAIDHPDAGTNGNQVDHNDDVRLTFNYTIKDAVDADTANGTLKVSIGDDGPVANAESKSVAAAGSVDTNLMIVLDLSGSMTDDSGLQSLDRLQASKAAINELFEQYGSLGDVKVQIVTFSSGASTQNYNGSGGIWLSLSDAKAFINSLAASGSTNYDAALQQAIQAYTNAGKIDPVGNPQPVQNVAYFISDGDPTAGGAWPSIPGDTSDNGINANEEAAWIQFLKDNDINSYAIGIGTGITVSNLNPVAYNGAVESNTNGAQVSDLSQLAQFLTTAAQNNINGNVMSDNGTKIGADGGYVKSITYGDSTFTFNGTSSITRSVGGTVTFSASGNLLTITTAYGSMQINMLTGAYVFAVAATSGAVPAEGFSYVLHDSDGDEAGNSLTINITPTDSAPIVRDDLLVVANGADDTNGTFVVDDRWLLWNDSDRDGDKIAITAAAAGGTLLVGGDVRIDTDNNSFNYTGTSNGTSDDATVAVSTTNSSTINGNGLDNIIVGDTSNETINGYEGNDVLVGNNGSDRLFGGEGNDLLIGGNDNDSLDGGNGDDWLQGGPGTDTLAGGNGFDIADFSDAGSGVTISLNGAGNATVSGGSTDVLSSIEGLIGSSSADNLTGNNAANYLYGGGGADTLSGGAGDDTIAADSLDSANGGTNTAAANALLTAGTNHGDVLVFDSNINLTLAGLNGRFTNFETVSIKNADSGATGNQTLSLNINDVLDLSGSGTTTATPGGAGYSAQKAVRIDADSGDTVNLVNTGGTDHWLEATGATGVPAGYTLFVHVTSGTTPTVNEDGYVLVSGDGSNVTHS
ncbi:aggregation factor core protein MAFp3, isoform C [Hypericibacter adhaerens]|uniref:Aggregation factor core protein MAFp3, isoform C n=1 Tax=Hypericibacter adhaerens TaxID=2602016 RepID=A0A5J6N6A3_9PROT|nr:Calx-beta domain-containing protein [Hypericibacter adhaerens]QEX22456.1 aggregation factor core protein MAFp3, isoform C [Hypericibacter adhaerens]